MPGIGQTWRDINRRERCRGIHPGNRRWTCRREVMRSQYCREHVTSEVAKECGLGKDVVSDIQRAAKFCDEHPDLSGCSTRAIMALIRIKDEPVKNRAISLAEKALKEETPTGGKKKKELTEREIKQIVGASFKEYNALIARTCRTVRRSTTSSTARKRESA
jgi:hypothetical protein